MDQAETGPIARRVKRAVASLAALAAITAAPFATAAAQTRVDLELVLAVDISQSMDHDEHTLQRMGYVEAFRHNDVINALLSGPQGRIAVFYMEWAGDFEPYPTVPWTIIDSAEASRAFADRLEAEPIYGEQRTSISRALYTAARHIMDNDIVSGRQVIDVSGDGPNNAGDFVENARDAVIEQGIVINGLPILLGKPKEFYDIDHLDRYYRHCVIGGPGAFIAPVFDLKHLASTIRKKLVMEIAGLEVEPDMAPIQYAEDDAAPAQNGALLQRVQLKLPAQKSDCLEGEKVFGRGGWGGFGRQR